MKYILFVVCSLLATLTVEARTLVIEVSEGTPLDELISEECNDYDTITIGGNLKAKDIVSLSAFLRKVPHTIDCVDLGNAIVEGNALPGREMHGTSKVNTFILPKTLEDLGEHSFHSAMFKEIVWPELIKSIPAQCFAYCFNWRRLSIPATVETIGERAFELCNTEDGTVLLPEGLTRVEHEAFYNNWLHTIELPSTLEYIGGLCFAEAPWLTTVICHAEVPPTVGNNSEGRYYLTSDNYPTETSAFGFSGGAGPDAVLYVPAGCVDAYRNAPGFEEFSVILEIGSGVGISTTYATQSGELNDSCVARLGLSDIYIMRHNGRTFKILRK